MALNSCSDDEDVTTVCISFDERQCSGNPWLDDLIGSEGVTDKISALATYLSEQNIPTTTVSADPNFNQITCEACFICPAATRYTVEIDSTLSGSLVALNLLNISQSICN